MRRNIEYNRLSPLRKGTLRSMTAWVGYQSSHRQRLPTKLVEPWRVIETIVIETIEKMQIGRAGADGVAGRVS